VNGIGYDAWADELIAANPVDGRVLVDVGDLVGIKRGGNPHRWYSPVDVHRVIGEIVRGYTNLDPQGAAYFQRRQADFETHGLGRYRQLIASLKRTYHGVRVGASESVFAPLAQALGLRLATPASFLQAIGEGTDPTASDVTTIDRQVETKQIEVWVVNSQNSTPDVQRITDAARRKGIPVATITETLAPASASFQAWQVRELHALATALAKATGR
jgi:zinc/manganese transport system substrate-binding protein